MYKFTTVSDLSFLVGRELIQVCCGKFDIQLNFFPELNISIFGKITSSGNGGRTISFYPEAPDSSCLIDLIGLEISGYVLHDLRSLEITFSNNRRLLIDGSDNDAECYTVSYKGRLWVV